MNLNELIVELQKIQFDGGGTCEVKIYDLSESTVKPVNFIELTTSGSQVVDIGICIE